MTVFSGVRLSEYDTYEVIPGGVTYFTGLDFGPVPTEFLAWTLK